MFKLNPTIFAAFCIIMTALMVPGAEGKIITVANDGRPCDFISIQPAIDFAAGGDEIKVWPGTYYEAIDFGGKAVRLYSNGGPEVTIIDANGAYHAVQCVSGEDANTILEGFTITGGNANGPIDADMRGGGMYCESSNPTVTNCTFSGNTTTYDGGGMYNDNSSPTVSNCVFRNNETGEFGSGGGMYNINGSSPTVTNCTFSNNIGNGMSNCSSSPTVTNCTFSNNTFGGNGGGMYNQSSSPKLTNCNFTGNSSGIKGGGMYNYNNSNSIVSNCIFSNNKANGEGPDNGGGGMYNLNNSNPTVTNCTFSNNTANNSGGGIRNSGSSPAVTNCAFSGNAATFDGGGMYNYLSNPTLVNCIFWNNSASYGGGMYNHDNSSPTLTNCTFNANTCPNWGGGILNNSSSSPTLMNCILWGNITDQINDWDSPASTTTVSFSDVQGGWPGVVVIDSDPFFVDAAGGDLRLSSNASLCVDTGANFPGLPATDLSGNPRIVDGDRNGTAIVDMGAYEYQSWQIHNITQNNWYETIQAAIDAAANGDEIEVAAGTYNETIDFNSRAIRLYSSDGPDVTTIDGSGNYHVVQCVSGEGPNTILEGFTITGGNANGTGADARGGGMYNEYTSPTITNCIFTNNSATGGGGMFNMQGNARLTGCTFSFNSSTGESGGLHNHDCDAIVTNCIFIGNTSVFGGGMSNPYGSPTVSNCTFLANTASDKGGGGMYNRSGSTPTVTNCTFNSNLAQTYGGGMYNDAGLPTVTNCTFIKNESQASGGGIANYNSSHSIVTNCTFSDNVAVSGDGGGIRNWDSSPIIRNCILWGNEHDEISSAGTSEPVVNYSDIRGGHIGTGNINTDPNFVDANNPDPNLVNLRLLPGSPCIDAGDTTAIPLGISLDLEGNPRILDDPKTPDNGFGILGIAVDMGAYEFQPCPIAGDVNCDGVVDFKDVAILCNNWLAGTESGL